MQYKIGDKVIGEVVRILPSGVLVKLQNGPTGWIRKRELSWFHDVRQPSEIVELNQEIEAIVIKEGNGTDGLELSLKEAMDNPWLLLKDKLKTDSLVEGIVTKLYPNGAYILLEEGIEGFVPLSQISPRNINKPEEAILPGDSVLCCIKNIDLANREIVLSICDAVKEEVQSSLGNLYWDSLTKAYNEASLKYLQNRFGKLQTPQEAPREQIIVERKIDSILVVEDDEEVRISLRAMLERMGYSNVKTCISGEESVSLLEKEDFDLLLMDKNLPGIDGIEASRRILEKKPRVRIVIITGEPGWTEKLQEIQTLGCGFSLKPIDKEEMEQIIFDASTDSLTVDFPELEFSPGETRKEEIKEKVDWAQSLKNLIEHVLSQEKYQFGADVVAVFHIDFRTYNVTLVASNKDISASYEKEKYNLIYSPIKDVIIGEVPLLESDAPSFSSEKFRYLLPLLDFRSFMGVPITVNGRVNYGLFYFHRAPSKFTRREHLPRAQMIAELLGVMLEKNLLENQLTVSQKFVFSGEMSLALVHELRNRLTPISSDINVLKMDADDISSRKLVPTDKGFIARFISNIEAINRVKNDLLRSLDIFRGLMGTEKADDLEDINAIVSYAYQILTPQANESKVKLELSLSEDIPKTRTSKAKLQNIFINILLNAIQWVGAYRKDKGGRVVIKSCYESDDKDYPIKVRFIDNGPGIHTIDFDRIFEPLITTREEGTGIGLFACRSLARFIGAMVSVEKSLIFVGTTFRIDIPLKE